jgi:uncharacterized protein involved in response to NO
MMNFMKSQNHPLSIAPYQILFPLGFLHGIIGVSFWIAHVFGWMNYPGVQHAHEMMTGFLLSFVSGFLLTAIPHFTGSHECSRTELWIVTLLCSLSFVFHQAWVTLLLFIFICSFIFRRWRVGTFTPPVHFIFLPVGLFWGLFSSLTIFLIELNLINPAFLLPARMSLYQGTLLAFILGIGGKLLTAFLGWTPPPLHHIEKNIASSTTPKILFAKIPLLQASLFFVGIALEWTPLLGESGRSLGITVAIIGKILLAICVTWVGLTTWKLHSKPKRVAKQSFWVWIALLFLCLSTWVQAFFPSLGIHAEHLIFIIGYGLIIFIVAGRVTLSHGHYSLKHEVESPRYAVLSLCLLITAFTRFTAQWTAHYTHHLAYAALFWIFALGIWGYYFIPKIIVTNNSNKP